MPSLVTTTPSISLKAVLPLATFISFRLVALVNPLASLVVGSWVSVVGRFMRVRVAAHWKPFVAMPTTPSGTVNSSPPTP